MLCRWGKLRKHQVPGPSASCPRLEERLSCGLAKGLGSAAWQVPASLARSAAFPAESFLHPAPRGSSEGHVASCLCARCPFLQRCSPAPSPHSTHPLALITRSCRASCGAALSRLSTVLELQVTFVFPCIWPSHHLPPRHTGSVVKAGSCLIHLYVPRIGQ